MRNARARLLRLLAEKSFRLGNFTLSSGGTSDYYIDCRLTTLDAAGAVATGELVLEEIHGRKWQADAIGGLTMCVPLVLPPFRRLKLPGSSGFTSPECFAWSSAKKPAVARTWKSPQRRRGSWHCSRLTTFARNTPLSKMTV